MSGRRTTRRSPVRKRRRGKKQDERLVIGFVVLLGLGLCIAVVQWLLTHWWILVVLAALGAVGGAWWWHQHTQRRQWEWARARGLRYQLGQLDALHHTEFEKAVRDLMYRDGCADAVRVGGRGDNGADVKATDPAGRRWVIQCKHRRRGVQGSPVGTPALQVVNGTARQLHGAEVVVVVTNGRYTRDAVPFGKSQRIHLVDRRTLAQWAAGSQPLWELLHRIPPPRRSTPLA